MMLKIVRALVLEKNLRVAEAKAEIFGVLDELAEKKIVDHFVLDTIKNTTGRMIHREEYLQRYQSLIETLLKEAPKDKELVSAVFEGSV